MEPAIDFFARADLIKDPAVINPCLQRFAGPSRGVQSQHSSSGLNREIGADFPVADYEHQHSIVATTIRVEMHLIARPCHKVTIPEIARFRWRGRKHSNGV